MRASGAASVEQALDEIIDRGLVYLQRGTVVYQTIISRQYPQIDIQALCNEVSDHTAWGQGDDDETDWRGVRLAYLAWDQGR